MGSIESRLRRFEQMVADLIAPRGPRSAAEAHSLLLRAAVYGDEEAARILAAFRESGCSSIVDDRGVVWSW